MTKLIFLTTLLLCACGKGGPFDNSIITNPDTLDIREDRAHGVTCYWVYVSGGGPALSCVKTEPMVDSDHNARDIRELQRQVSELQGKCH